MIAVHYLLDKYGDWTPFIENAVYEAYFDEDLKQEFVVTLEEDFVKAMDKKMKLKM